MTSSLRQLANLIARETENISTSELVWHPQGKWSVAQILEHLSLTYSGPRLGFDRCFQAGKPSATTPTLKDRIRAFIVTRVGLMPGGRQAPAGARPKGIGVSDIVANISNAIAAMDESIGRCEQRFGGNVKIVNHPILGPLTAQQWRKFHLVHGRHHLGQIRRLRKLIAAQVKTAQS